MRLFLCRGRAWHYGLLALLGVLAVIAIEPGWTLDGWRHSVIVSMLATSGLLYLPGWRGLALLTAAMTLTGTVMMALIV